MVNSVDQALVAKAIEQVDRSALIDLVLSRSIAVH